MVSVVIPIYNVCRYIERGLKNVFSQTYQDYEILLSDDGSTDGSYEECQKWALKDSRIRLLHQDNKGAGAARNHGINEAKGEFIYFFDIDDEINPQLLEYCVRTMNEKEVDFICFGYNNIEMSYKSKVVVSFPETLISGNIELRNLFVDQFVMKDNGFPWNKFYRKSFLDKYNLRYEDQRIEQDEVFNLKCYQYLESAYLSPKVLYNYYVYEKGNTRSRFIPDRFEIYKSVRSHFEDLENYWNLRDKRFNDYLNSRFYLSVFQCVCFNLMHPNCPWTLQEKRTELNNIMDDDLTVSSFNFADSHYRGVEHFLFRKACRNRSLLLVLIYNKIFLYLHHFRRKYI